MCGCVGGLSGLECIRFACGRGPGQCRGGGCCCKRGPLTWIIKNASSALFLSFDSLIVWYVVIGLVLYVSLSHFNAVFAVMGWLLAGRPNEDPTHRMARINTCSRTAGVARSNDTWESDRNRNIGRNHRSTCNRPRRVDVFIKFNPVATSSHQHC